MSLKHVESYSLQEYFMIFDDLIRNIKSAKIKIEGDIDICHLLMSLPESYNFVIAAIETLLIDHFMLDFIKAIF